MSTSPAYRTYTEPDKEFPDMLHEYAARGYYGITHHVPFGQAQRLYRVQTWLHMALLRAWKRWRCPGNVHCFDEAWSASSHVLHCDACGLMVHIDKIEVGYVETDANAPPP